MDDNGPIPKETIARLLETSSFEHSSTRITEDVVEGLQKYMELFVREAIMRSIETKAKLEEENSFTGVRVELTHTDLEEIAGLLLLDMS
ncbi:hypothetical protein Kpol_530p37 [Vanderwaltozyma polyspora DSM 70294]|uniref:MHF histone-fold complex subunit 2 n=1 Tax=Vanderwaltozyma polyspora (strain ATCC 22028 / DSM 70294 / BCRC 21397 / CBS 2163 / NBRC 10782 / NRRL Y-8283 / UCD 57-17) TaxID=436907 RepID=A7TL11_VANPO|nr:uncharacterized protein Kpol_530p37 [Vanderwaltozyma polyspora DSM 70294]EDO17067.1 hypothetical protein Kpol_530p37 [Vanderwaltozyma polyspora DSM 70294]